MKTRPLNTKTDLIELLKLVSPTRACHRAIREGRVIVLGGFTPPGDFPQYLARVESVRGKHWYLGVKIDETEHRFRPVWYESADVPWAYWDGRAEGKHPLRDGDEPKESLKRKAFAALRERTANARTT